MFSKLALLAVATMAVFVAATPAEGGIENSCNTGAVQCCNSIHESESEEVKTLKAIFGIEIPVGTKVGAQCSPLSVIGVGGGASCGSQPVCCSNNSFNGIIAIGCSPVNLNL